MTLTWRNILIFGFGLIMIIDVPIIYKFVGGWKSLVSMLYDLHTPIAVFLFALSTIGCVGYMLITAACLMNPFEKWLNEHSTKVIN
jgi:hypothetical protein